jgi:asparagine synthase (glutamine-hydrolysing)
LANVVIVVDEDRIRRVAFIDAITPRLAPVDGLVTGASSCGDFSVVWAAEPRAPISQVGDDTGAAVIWGEAIRGPGPERLNAAGLLHAWTDAASLSKMTYDGIHGAAVYRPEHGLFMGADLLGIFPLYYMATQDVIVAGTSPELFRNHPAFRMEFDPEGLVGMLLTMHVFDGRTLLRGARRLAAGHALVWRPGKPPREIRQYQVPVSNWYAGLPFTAHVELLGHTLGEAVARHAPRDARYSLLLSGGRDSRLLAGYLKQNGADVIALTLGLPADFDMRWARAVARDVGFEYRSAEVAASQYPACSRLQSTWEHGANGFTTIHGWGVYPQLRSLPPRVVTGHVSDSIVGGSHVLWARDASTGAMSFDAFFTRINAYGFRPEVLKRLLRREVFGDLVPETIARMRQCYESYSDLEAQRAWCFDLYHRQRFHSGGEAWRLSFGAWPVFPAVDRAVLDTAGGIPASTLMNRRAQERLLATWFPALARLPLAHNPFRVELARPRLRALLRLHLERQRSNLARLAARVSGLKLQQRYNARVYDINAPGWIAIRRQVEPYRDLAHGYFHRQVLDAILPPPDVPIRCNDGIVDSSGHKTLLGLLLWLKDHL